MPVSKYEAFLKAAELGSLTRAAAELGVTQSAVSHMIGSLEEELGFSLLKRGRTGARPTAEGERVLPAIRGMLNSKEQLEQTAAAIRGLDCGTVRIGTFTSVAVHWLPGMIKRFQAACPNVELKLMNGDYHDVEQWLSDGSCDLGFVALPTKQRGRVTALLEDRLLRFGFDVYRTREPGGCSIAEKIRQLLLDPANGEMTDVTEALLYAASRAQHVRQVIRPALEAGKLVLCDRFVDSSVAYQGGGRKLGVARVKEINAPAVDGTMPDATVYLDIDHVAAMKRRSAATTLDRLELQAESFHGRVEAAYQEIVAAEPERFVRVDAAQAPEKVAEDIWRQVLDRLTEAEA